MISLSIDVLLLAAIIMMGMVFFSLCSCVALLFDSSLD